MTASDAYSMCKTTALQSTNVSKSAEGHAIWKIMLHLAWTSPEVFDIHWSRNGPLNATGETRIWYASNKLFGSHWTLAVPIKSAVKKQARCLDPSAPKATVTSYGISFHCKGRSSPQASSLADAPQ